MKRSELLRLVARLMRCPAVAYHEHAVRAEVERICAEHDLECRQDEFGNLLTTLQTARRQRPFVLAAHMDHPGFEIIRADSPTRFRAQFLGGVPANYFRPGTRLRLMPGSVPATLDRESRKGEFTVRAEASSGATPAFAVWELKDFTVRGDRIAGRACDDLVGVACILATLIDLKRQRARVNVIGVISRAEEIGFRGALAVAASRNLPANAMVISLETSRELPGGKMGQGVIIRVGDRSSIFDSAATRFLSEVATGLKGDGGFQFQRALMSGGTCEATAYQEFGFQTAAVCVALGNYHNCGPRNAIREEYVSVKDAGSMVELLASAARQMSRYGELTGKLPHRLRKMLKESEKRLVKSASGSTGF